MDIPGPGQINLTASLRDSLKRMGSRDRSHVRELYEYWSGECRASVTKDPASVAYSLHIPIDEQVHALLTTHPKAPEVKCHRGCAGCCHLNVDVTPHEAALLRYAAARHDIAIDEDRLDRQAATDGDLDKWRKLDPADRACIFLAPDRSCAVYEYRPAACRKYLVITEPELCDSFKYPGGAVGILFSVEAEVIQTAAMTVFGAENMARALVAVRPATTTPPTPEKTPAEAPGASRVDS